MGSPQVETSIYTGSEGSISLQTVQDASYHPTHPADVPVETFEKVLRGIHYQRYSGWLQRLVDHSAEPIPLFSPSQVTFWAPHLQHAFSKATAEEQITLRIPLDPSSEFAGEFAGEFHHLTGMLSLTQHDLQMALTLSGRGLRSKTRPNQPDSLGNTPPAIVFLPKNAVKKKPAAWYRGTPSHNHVTIDMAVLGMPDGTVSTKNGKREPATPDATPRRVAPAVMPSDESMSPRQLEPISPSDSKALLEEIRSLRRELSRQKQEIEHLKKREAEAP